MSTFSRSPRTSAATSPSPSTTSSSLLATSSSLSTTSSSDGGSSSMSSSRSSAIALFLPRCPEHRTARQAPARSSPTRGPAVGRSRLRVRQAAPFGPVGGGERGAGRGRGYRRPRSARGWSAARSGWWRRHGGGGAALVVLVVGARRLARGMGLTGKSCAGNCMVSLARTGHETRPRTGTEGIGPRDNARATGGTMLEGLRALSTERGVGPWRGRAAARVAAPRGLWDSDPREARAFSTPAAARRAKASPVGRRHRAWATSDGARYRPALDSATSSCARSALWCGSIASPFRNASIASP